MTGSKDTKNAQQQPGEPRAEAAQGNDGTAQAAGDAATRDREQAGQRAGQAGAMPPDPHQSPAAPARPQTTVTTGDTARLRTALANARAAHSRGDAPDFDEADAALDELEGGYRAPGWPEPSEQRPPNPGSVPPGEHAMAEETPGAPAPGGVDAPAATQPPQFGGPATGEPGGPAR